MATYKHAHIELLTQKYDRLLVSGYTDTEAMEEVLRQHNLQDVGSRVDLEYRIRRRSSKEELNESLMPPKAQADEPPAVDNAEGTPQA